ncbi:unnamed protein product [Prunus armeniaca]|uniref:Uncharacterized protein n=1 Tax=Prunus armeniaca TaxID=36596 RepID=A0A6J5X4K2_PRUAR|nr:unnamed protein product [Prunus armeniaca]
MGEIADCVSLKVEKERTILPHWWPGYVDCGASRSKNLDWTVAEESDALLIMHHRSSSPTPELVIEMHLAVAVVSGICLYKYNSVMVM